MPRVKRGVATHKRHKKIREKTKGYYGARSRTYKAGHEQVMHSLAYAYRHRREKKREFRSLWITRINAAARAHGISYNRFIYGLKLAEVELNRKVLSDLAVSDPETFGELVKLAKEKLAQVN